MYVFCGKSISLEVDEMLERKQKHYLELSAGDLRIIFEGLMNWRNRLLAEGHPVEPIDDILIRIINLI